VLLPLGTLGIYAVVFGVILTPRWPGFSDPLSFTLVLFAGLIVFNLFSEAIGRMPGLLVTQASFVKKVVFPLEILVWVPILSALVGFAISLVLWAILQTATGGVLHLSVTAVPLILVPTALLMAGLGWWLAAVGVFVRDTVQAVAPVLQLLLYLAPVIYPIEAVPGAMRWLFWVNPVTLPVTEVRRSLVYGQWPDPVALLIYSGCALLVYWSGRLFFRRVRHGFADVL
jgi:lipopolysaccharide transport system permease protein